MHDAHEVCAVRPGDEHRHAARKDEQWHVAPLEYERGHREHARGHDRASRHAPRQKRHHKEAAQHEGNDRRISHSDAAQARRNALAAAKSEPRTEHVPGDRDHDRQRKQQVYLPLRVDGHGYAGKQHAHQRHSQRAFQHVARKGGRRSLCPKQTRHVRHANRARAALARVAAKKHASDNHPAGNRPEQKRLENGQT